jgi:hypothetical protein
VPWQTSLAAFAFVRLLTVLPVTPGGAGITELGLVGILAAGADHKVAAQVTAAVLLYRAVTYLVPIPGGAVACLAWRYAPALLRGGIRAGTTAPAGDLRASPDSVGTFELAMPQQSLRSVRGRGKGGARRGLQEFCYPEQAQIGEEGPDDLDSHWQPRWRAPDRQGYHREQD